ncbi:MAG: hypothetical protein ACYSVY_04440, partial [Planctomycetota bacterium]
MRYPRTHGIFQRNKDEDIKRGFRVRNGRITKLQRLKGTTLKRNVCLREDCPKQTKRWILTKYDDGARVGFIQLDFDKHIPDDALPEERQAIEESFDDLIERFLELGIPVVWTTSPGKWVNGEHVQGRYA